MRTKFIIKIKNREIFYGNGFSISLKNTNFPYLDNEFYIDREYMWLTEIVTYNEKQMTVALSIKDYNYKDDKKFENQNPNNQLKYIEFLDLKFNSFKHQLVCHKEADFNGIALDVNIPQNDVTPDDTTEETLNDNDNFAVDIDKSQNDDTIDKTQEETFNDVHNTNDTFTQFNTAEKTIRKEPTQFQDIIYLNFDNIEFKDKKIGIYIPDYKLKNFLNEVYYDLPIEKSKKEFQAIKEYIRNKLGDRIEIYIVIVVKDTGNEITDISSPTLNKINDDLIREIKNDEVKKLINAEYLTDDLLLLSDLIKDEIFKDYSPREIIIDYIKSHESIHKRELNYLVELHLLTDKIELEFIINPEFAFLFYLESENRCNFILETFKTDNATYIWQLNQKANYNLIEFEKYVKSELIMLYNVGRIKYRKLKNDSFKFIVHDNYEENGYEKWKYNLETETGLNETHEYF